MLDGPHARARERVDIDERPELLTQSRSESFQITLDHRELQIRGVAAELMVGWAVLLGHTPRMRRPSDSRQSVS